MMLSRRTMLKLLACGATVTASGLVLPVPVLAATSRRTGSNESISTFKATGGDYTSLSTWEADTDIDLVTAATTEVLELYADGSPYSLGSAVTFQGATTNSSFRRIIRGAAGQGYNGIPGNGVVFTSTIDANFLVVNESNFQVQNFTVQLLSNTGATNRTGLVFTSAGGLAVGMLCKATHSGSANTGLALSGNNVSAVNCLAYECDSNGLRFNTSAGAAGLAYNCTAIGNTADGFSVQNINDCVVVLKNCLGSGNGTDFDTFDTGTTNCASSDATANGTNARVSQTFTFVNAAGDDYHLSAADAGALGFGADLSADATFAFDDDVDGQTITTWSIGFDSHVAAPPAASARRRVFRW